MARFGLRARGTAGVAVGTSGENARGILIRRMQRERREGEGGEIGLAGSKRRQAKTLCPLPLSSKCTPMSHFLNMERAKLLAAGKRRITFQGIAVNEARMWTHRGL